MTAEILGSERVKLEFFGQVYHLKADDADVDVHAVVEYVQTKVAEQVRANPNLPNHKQVVLAVLTMAKDYVQAQTRLRQMEKRVATCTDSVVLRIDALLKSDS